ncbi:MAG: group II intron reverse transcriptase/maturase (plasmid) [Leptolyngbya sp. BL-A-14]
MTTYEWKTLSWRKLERKVFKLQKQIYRATCRGQRAKVRRLQRLLIRSWAARVLAVRRVTQENAGKKTAGIDGFKSLPPYQRLALAAQLKHRWGQASPTRRVWIPKPGNPAEQRPLNIPTIEDRARQTLFKLALEPQWEAKFEPNSYGFRPGRSCQDAIMAIYLKVCHQPKWLLDADLAKCFDTIAQQPLLEKLNASPFVTRQIRAWLRAGVMDNFHYSETPEGVPQGGSLSPLLANVALHGMETYVARYCKGAQVVRYADDLVVIHPERKGIEHAQRLLSKWLQKMGLALKPSKTRLCHTLHAVDGQAGFDFLGFAIRQYRVSKYKSGRSMKGYKTIIQPSTAAIQRHTQRLRGVIRSHKAAPQAALIDHLNPIIRGWSGYYSAQCSKAAFSQLDSLLYQKLRAWAHRRHPSKSGYWRASRYWLVNQGGGWVFAARRGEKQLRLRTHSDTPIVRHIKVQGNRSLFDGDWSYWATRMGNHPELPTQIAKLLKHQRGKCAHCHLYFKSEDLLEVHHLDKNHQNHKWDNLTLMHQHCHDQVHSGMHDKHPVVEEPCEVNVSRTVL